MALLFPNLWGLQGSGYAQVFITGYIVKGGPDTGSFTGGVFMDLGSKINYGINEQRVLVDAKPGIIELAWNDVIGVNQSPTSLTKTAVDGWGNAGAVSNNTLDTLENGWLQYTVNSTSDILAFGLSTNNTDAHYNSINYAVMINAGQLSIYNNGQLIGNYGAVALNDSIRISRIGNMLFFTKNSQEVYNQAVEAKQPLMADVSIYIQGIAVQLKSSFAKPCDANLNVVIATTSQTILSGATATLIASGAASYLWSTGETTNSISVSPTATKSYTVTGYNSGCLSNAVSVITVTDLFSDSDKITPDGLFDSVFDKDGRKYNLKNLLIPGIDPNINAQTIPIPCTSGYFNLYYEVGSGMEGNTAIEIARRNVLCQVLNDISSFIPAPSGSPLATGVLHINLWVKDINTLVSNASTSSVLGTASSFYSMPYIFTPPIPGGIADNEIYKTIVSGHDSYTNVTSPLIINNAPPGTASFYHGLVTFNFSNPLTNWETNLTATSTSLNDLYSVALHEITHALGIASFINFDGNSRLGNLFPYYSRFDRFLTNPTGTPLIESNNTACSAFSLYDYHFNANVSVLAPGCTLSPPVNNGTLNNTVCANALNYSGTNTIPLYTPVCYEEGKSLSHFEDQCFPTGTPYGNDVYFTMSNQQNAGVFKRFPKLQERTVLCDLGYSVNGSYGSSAVFNSLQNYGTSACAGADVIGLNDGLSGSTFVYTSTVGGAAITITDILNNDIDLGSGGPTPSSFECLEVIYGGGTVSLTGTTFTYTPSPTPGVILLRYIPVSHSGQRGNITYVFIYNQSNFNCTADACNMIPNGDFEQHTSLPSYYGQMNTTCGWGDANSGSGDYFHAAATNIVAQVPCNFIGAENDNQINGQAYAGIGLYEVIYTKLSSPLAPNTNYQLTLDASVAEEQSNHTYPLTVYFAQNYVYGTLTSNSSTLLLPSTGPTFINNFNGWTPVTINFTTGSTSGVDCGQDYILIGSLPMYTTTIGTQPPAQMGSLGCSTYTIASPNLPMAYIYIDNIVLKPTSTVTFNPPSIVCEGQTIDLESYVSINGGTFTGVGVNGNIFSASSAGNGTHTITYTYTDNLGCINSVDALITINNLTLSSTLPTICPGNAFDISPYITPAGGTFSGSTITSAGIFNATVAGTYTITYNLGSCSANFNIQVSSNCCTSNSGVTIGSAGALSSSIGTSFPIGTTAINGNFTINNNFSVTNGVLIFAPNVKIIIMPGAQLTIDKSKLYSCSTLMWDGIEIRPGGMLIVTDSKIEDAKIAVYSDNTGGVANFRIENKVAFNRNYIAIKVYNHTTGIQHPGIIRGCSFDSQSSSTSTNNSSTLDAPYNNQTAQIGVELDNVNSFQVGDAAAGGYKNVFKYLRLGIKAKNSVYYVYNNEFKNNFLTNCIAPVGGPPCPTIGWAIWNEVNTACIVGGYATNQSNNFESLANGILHQKGWFLIVQNNIFKNIAGTNPINSFAINTTGFTGGFLSLVQIADNIFEKIRTGVLHQNNTNTTLYVFGNTFNDFRVRAINAVQNKNGLINISSGGQYSLPNTFVQPASSNYTSDVAINVGTAFAPLSNSPSVIIVGNTITRVKNGILLTAINSPTVNSNNITFKNNATSGFGIRSANGFNETINLNVITRGNPIPTNAYENGLYGISIESNVGGAKVTENKVIRMGTGLRFRSYNVANTTVKCNIMTNNWAGLTLDAVNIGNQGQPAGGIYPQGIASDNQWSSIPNNMNGAVSVRGKNSYTPVKFYTRSANYPWCPVANKIQPGSTIITSSNTLGQPTIPSALASCSNICYNPPCNQARLAQIARNQNPFNAVVGTARFTMQESVIRAVQADSIAPDTTSADGVDLQHYVDTVLSTTNAGKLVQVSYKYANSDLAGATVLNNSIIPSTCADEYHQTVNRIFLTSWAIDSFSFSPIDSTTLYIIAMQDPLECGTAIYDARIMLSLDINDYSMDNRMLEFAERESIIADKIGVLYPNPAQNKCTYEATLTEGSNGMIMMYELNGKLISSYKLETGYNKLDIDLNQYPSGIYLYKIYINGEVVDYKKLVIAK